jgi:excisionase family DNA binding protein
MKSEEDSGTPEGRKPLPERVQGAQDATTEARGLSAARLLTADQLAERWQVPKAHIYRLARTGKIPLVRLGRYFRFRLDAIETWEEEGQPHV